MADSAKDKRLIQRAKEGRAGHSAEDKASNEASRRDLVVTAGAVVVLKVQRPTEEKDQPRVETLDGGAKDD